MIGVGSGGGVLLKRTPPGKPSLVAPNFQKIEMDRLRRDVASVRQYMTSEQEEWWMRTLLNFEHFNG